MSPLGCPEFIKTKTALPLMCAINQQLRVFQTLCMGPLTSECVVTHLTPISLALLHRKLTTWPPFRYSALLELGENRKDKLMKSCKKFMVYREASELLQWIGDKEGSLTGQEEASDLEQVEVLQKKIDDFQKVHPSLYWSMGTCDSCYGCQFFSFY